LPRSGVAPFGDPPDCHFARNFPIIPVLRETEGSLEPLDIPCPRQQDNVFIRNRLFGFGATKKSHIVLPVGSQNYSTLF
jgi:hypothetical protein